MFESHRIYEKFEPDRQIVVYPGDCLDLLDEIPDDAIQLVVTSGARRPGINVDWCVVPRAVSETRTLRLPLPTRSAPCYA